MEPVHHFPPEVLQLLTQAIGYLNKSKPNVLDFFRGAGVPADILAPLDDQVHRDRGGISKFEIARQVLVQLNDLGDAGLGPRREVVRRVVEFDSFECCWPDDHLKAKGLGAARTAVVVRQTAPCHAYSY
jgi:restriction system protein